jgi:hypothetical protein
VGTLFANTEQRQNLLLVVEALVDKDETRDDDFAQVSRLGFRV